MGKSVGDLQSNIAVSASGAVTGTLKYVTGYTGFSGVPAEQSGNYLALHFSSTNDEAVITVQTFGGLNDGRIATLDGDGILITKVLSNDEVIKVTAAVPGGEATIKTFDLSGLTLTAAS